MLAVSGRVQDSRRGIGSDTFSFGKNMKRISRLLVLSIVVFAAVSARAQDKATRAPKDDPAAVAAFKDAGKYKRCERNANGNVISVNLSAIMLAYNPKRYRLHLQCLKNLKGFPELRKVVTMTDYPAEELDYIAELGNLETLEIHDTQLTDRDLIAIEGMASLKRLSLNGNCRMTDASLEFLAGMKSLEDLDLSSSAIRGTGLGWLKGLKNLKKLDLSGTKLGDAQMAHVAGLANLEELNLNATNITPNSLGQLSRLTKLKRLTLLDTRIREADTVALKKSLPKLTIKLSSTRPSRGPTERCLP